MVRVPIEDVETDMLICGAGPAGAALACFLSQHGLNGFMIAAAPSTADTPRAHVTNMGTMECLRDLGLDKECLDQATPAEYMENVTWCHSMVGREYGRIHSFGHDPDRYGAYAAASPFNHIDLPQTLLEPILIKRAEAGGWRIRFSTTLVSLSREDNGKILSRLKDNETGAMFNVRSTYLFGCDGARSQVVREINLPLIRKPGGGIAVNVLVDIDISHLIKPRNGMLHWVLQPARDSPEYSSMAIVRNVKPWTQWMVIVFPQPWVTDVSAVTNEQWMAEVRTYIGDDSIPASLIGISTWKVNEVVAERFSDGNIFCLGDAVHRHPPFNGLGSNTCIQDAYNLAWKVAYVLKSKAQPSMLQSYSDERQPVGVEVITRANDSYRANHKVWSALGANEPTREQREQVLKELDAATPQGRQRRADLQRAIEGTVSEFSAVGVEMNQRYLSSAVYLDDEVSKTAPLPEDPVLDHLITTYPGSRLPHAWLDTSVPVRKFSILDLAGHTAFCLFTGNGGEAWKTAARKVSEDMGITVNAYSIGWGEDYEDPYFNWTHRREVEEDGAVLVRPDEFVCWRSMSMIDDCETKLRTVLRSVLGFS